MKTGLECLLSDSYFSVFGSPIFGRDKVKNCGEYFDFDQVQK